MSSLIFLTFCLSTPQVVEIISCDFQQLVGWVLSQSSLNGFTLLRGENVLLGDTAEGAGTSPDEYEHTTSEVKSFGYRGCTPQQDESPSSPPIATHRAIQTPMKTPVIWWMRPKWLTSAIQLKG